MLSWEAFKFWIRLDYQIPQFLLAFILIQCLLNLDQKLLWNKFILLISSNFYIKKDIVTSVNEIHSMYEFLFMPQLKK